MPRQVKANESTAARRRVYFQLVLGTDGKSPALSEAGGQPQAVVNGTGGWTNSIIGVLVGIGNGRYYADLTLAAVANVGDIIETRYKSDNTDECPGDTIEVVSGTIIDVHERTSLIQNGSPIIVASRSIFSGATGFSVVLKKTDDYLPETEQVPEFDYVGNEELLSAIWR